MTHSLAPAGSRRRKSSEGVARNHIDQNSSSKSNNWEGVKRLWQVGLHEDTMGRCPNGQTCGK